MTTTERKTRVQEPCEVLVLCPDCSHRYVQKLRFHDYLPDRCGVCGNTRIQIKWTAAE